MKFFCLILLAMAFLIACGSEPRSSRQRYTGHDSPSSGESQSRPAGGILNFGDSADSSEAEPVEDDEDSSVSAPEESLSMEEAGKKTELRRMCEFKKDHILNDDEQVRFFKKNIIIRGEEEFLPIKEIIKEKEITGWKAWFEWADFKIMNSGRNKVTFHDDEFIVPYKYDKNEEYGDWCPSEGLCIVRVIYNGAIKEDLSEQVKGKPLTGWQSMGDLIARVQFAGKVLDFSACDSVD